MRKNVYDEEVKKLAYNLQRHFVQNNNNLNHLLKENSILKQKITELENTIQENKEKEKQASSLIVGFYHKDTIISGLEDLSYIRDKKIQKLENTIITLEKELQTQKNITGKTKTYRDNKYMNIQLNSPIFNDCKFIGNDLMNVKLHSPTFTNCIISE